MKKLFCFHCQKDVKPFSFWKWRFCPQCKRQMTDKGDGFYMVCDRCGANLPPDAGRCLKCGQELTGDKSIGIYAPKSFLFDNDWPNLIFGFIAFVLFMIVGLGVLYVSFYLIFFFVLIGLIMFLFNLLKAKL